MSEETPKLRHEFVGMMFAITIGEVGLQTAALVKAEHWIHYLPAYAHLILASIVIATSWVGWSLSRASGGRHDVRGIFQLEFLVLLIDVSLVITYFILVRTVDFGGESKRPRIDSASSAGWWIVVIFALYLVWDFVTKIGIYFFKPDGDWLRDQGSRMIPTILCLIISVIVWRQVQGSDLLHWISADFALVCIVLLFRALKDFVAAWLPRTGHSVSRSFLQRATPIFWSVVCIMGVALGTVVTKFSWPFLPCSIAEEISRNVSTEANP
jgi:hypothetical protein